MPGGKPPLSDEEIAAMRHWFAGQCLAIARRRAREGRAEEAALWVADAEKYGPPGGVRLGKAVPVE